MVATERVGAGTDGEWGMKELSGVMVIFPFLIETRVTQVYASVKTLCKCYSQDLCISLYVYKFYLKKIMNIH